MPLAADTIEDNARDGRVAAVAEDPAQGSAVGHGLRRDRNITGQRRTVAEWPWTLRNRTVESPSALADNEFRVLRDMLGKLDQLIGAMAQGSGQTRLAGRGFVEGGSM